MGSKNKHGLKRAIPLDVKLKVRQECGFGCVLCGGAIVQYDHVDPEFHDAKTHDPACMALLCGSCHDKKTRGLISTETVKNGRSNPFCRSQGVAGSFALDVGSNDFSVKIHGLDFTNVANTIRLNGCNVLSLQPPEGGKVPPRISAKFFDSKGRRIGSIEGNEWSGEWDALDINWQGPTLEVRSKENDLDLKVTLQPPNGLIIERMNLFFDGARVIVDKSGLRTENDGGTKLSVDRSFTDTVKDVAVGIDIGPKGIGLGTGKSFTQAGAIAPSQVGVVGKGGMTLRPTKPGEVGSPFPAGVPVMDLKFTDDQGRPVEISIGGITISPVDED